MANFRDSKLALIRLLFAYLIRFTRLTPWLSFLLLVNPFAKRESHSTQSITTYKVLTILSWILSVVVSVYYVVYEPTDGFHIRRRIWDQNYLYPTAFTMNSTIADIYW